MSVKGFSRSASAFTLIELLAVVAIIVMLLGMSVGYSRKAQENRTNQDIETFISIFEGMPSLAKSTGFLKFDKEATLTSTSALSITQMNTHTSIKGGKREFLWKVVNGNKVIREGTITPNGKNELRVEYSTNFTYNSAAAAEHLESGVAVLMYDVLKDRNTTKKPVLLGAVIYNENGTPMYPGKVVFTNYKSEKKYVRRVEVTIAKNGGVRREITTP